MSSALTTATAPSATAPPRTRLVARLTGMAYFGILVTGIFAEFVVRQSLIVPGDAVATAQEIADSAGLFRAGIAGDVLMISFDVAVAIGFYLLLRHISRPIALLAAAFRMTQAAVLGANLANLSDALGLSTLAAADGSTDVLPQLALTAVETHALTYDLALVFFGIACLLLGHLLRVSQTASKLLALSLSAAGLVYLVGSTAAVFAPDVQASFDALYGLAFAAELAVATWLIRKAGRTPVAPAASVAA